MTIRLFFGSGPGFVNWTQSDPGFVNPVRSGPGFVNPIRSDPVQVLLTPSEHVNKRWEATEVKILISAYKDHHENLSNSKSSKGKNCVGEDS